MSSRRCDDCAGRDIGSRGPCKAAKIIEGAEDTEGAEVYCANCGALGGDLDKMSGLGQCAQVAKRQGRRCWLCSCEL